MRVEASESDAEGDNETLLAGSAAALLSRRWPCRPVHDCITFDRPAWSPDAETLAVAIDKRLMLFDRAGDAPPRQVRVGALDVDGVSWAPDGLAIAFAATPSDGPPVAGRFPDLYRVDLRTQRVRRLTWRGAQAPAWWPKGGRIAFTRFGSDRNPRIYTISTTGQRLRRVTRGLARDPAWSPQGKQLAFVRDFAHHTELRRMRAGAATSRRVRTPNEEWYQQTPTWVPDGESLAYAAHGGIHLQSIGSRSSSTLLRAHGQTTYRDPSFTR